MKNYSEDKHHQEEASRLHSYEEPQESRLRSDMAEFNKPKWQLPLVFEMKDRCSEKQVLGYVLTVGVKIVEWESRLQKSITIYTKSSIHLAKNLKNEEPCRDVHQVGDEREVEALSSLNLPPRLLMNGDSPFTTLISTRSSPYSTSWSTPFNDPGLARFLKETAPQVEPPAEGQSSNAQAVQAVEAWKHSDFLCHNYVLNVYRPSWVEFKNYLKHKRKEMSVEDLVVRLRIEEDNKLAQKDSYTPDSAKANMVEHAGIFSSRSSRDLATTIEQRGHDCAMVSDVCAMISEVNLVGTNNSGWWIDTGATRYVCADKSMFHSFRAVDNGQKLFMGNSATADIKGEGDVILKMTSEKEAQV
ncbi:hypothetical protein Tco_0540645 [Tanacetum coccineum]